MIKYELIIYWSESDQAFVLVSVPEGLSFEVSSKACTPRLRLSPTRGLTAIVEVPELPGCMADGQTYVEAVTNAEVVIQEWIETAQELGRDIPTPKGRLLYA